MEEGELELKIARLGMTVVTQLKMGPYRDGLRRGKFILKIGVSLGADLQTVSHLNQLEPPEG